MVRLFSGELRLDLLDLPQAVGLEPARIDGGEHLVRGTAVGGGDMGRVDLVGAPLLRHGDGRHQVQSQECKVCQVVP